MTAVALASIAGAAVFVRTWRLAPHARIPDTYEQIAATNRLLDGDLPLSNLYPPGVALVLAPFFAVLPNTVPTAQAVVVGASLVLVALAYIAARAARADGASALLFVATIALSPAFVTMSRVGLFDAIGTALLVSSVLAAPALRRMPWPAWLAFAAVLSVALAVRATNIFILPALLATYAGIGPEGRRLEPMRRALISPPVYVTTILTLAMTFVLLVPGFLPGASSGVRLAPKYVPAHVLFYWFAALGGLMIPLVAPMAAIGAMRVWRIAPAVVVLSLYLIVVWPVVHAPFPFVNERYMLLPLFFVLLLAAHGPVEWWRIAGTRRSPLAAMGRITAVMASLLLIAISAVIVGDVLRGWGVDTGLSDESALEELRPAVDGLEGDAVIVTAIARGFDRSQDDRAYVDLIDHRIDMRDRASSIAELIATIESAMRSGRAVYYLYSRFEEDGENAGLGGAGIDIYFTAVSERFTVDERFRATQQEYRIYSVTPP